MLARRGPRVRQCPLLRLLSLCVCTHSIFPESFVFPFLKRVVLFGYCVIILFGFYTRNNRYVQQASVVPVAYSSLLTLPNLPRLDLCLPCLDTSQAVVNGVRQMCAFLREVDT